MLKPKEKKRIFTYVSGLLYYYGVVEQTDLYQMVTAGLPVQLTEDELIASLDETVLTDDGTYYFAKEGNYYYWMDVDDIEWVIKEQASRPSIPWRPVSETEARHIVAQNFHLLWNKQTKVFYNFLCDHHEDKEDAAAMIEGLSTAVNNDVPMMEIISYVAEHLDFNMEVDFPLLSDIVMKFYNNKSQWALKGWSPEKVGRIYNLSGSMPQPDNVVPLRTKVGRNEPCPCGSGEKYKRCCWPKEQMSVIQEVALTLTPEEYETLAIMLYIGDWVINSCKVGEDRENKYAAVYEKVCSQAGKFGKEEIVSYFPGRNSYDLASEYGDDGLAMEFIQEYEDYIFWDELGNRLAKRDLLREYGREAIEKMEPKESIRRLLELEEYYNDVFCNQGLDALVIEKGNERTGED
jgi:hypothetical protein